MARGESKRNGSEPFSATGGGQQAKSAFYPLFAESNLRIACCPTVLQAARASHPECVAWHLKQRDCLPKLLRHQQAQMQRPLHEAAGATPINESHRTPRCTMCVEVLLASGLTTSWLDENGRSPLERAAVVGCVPCIETLLRSPTVCVNTDAFCEQRSAALQAAALVNSEASVRALLGPAATAGPLTSESRLGPALVEAVKAGAYDCITPLVEAGAVLNPIDGDGRLALLAKAVYGKDTTEKKTGDRAPDIIRLLVELGAQVNTHYPSRCRTALHASASKGRCDCMQTLLELGAKPMALDSFGRSPLHLAASSHHDEACELLVKHITEVSTPATAAAALLAKDASGETPLHLAVSWGRHSFRRPEVASCLPMLLHLLEASGGLQAVAGAFREKAKYKGRTILHSAAGNARDDCLRVLTANPEGLRVALEVKDDDGMTPIALARQVGHDLDDISAFARVPYDVPCCSSLTEAAEERHVGCVKRILVRDGYPKMVEVDGTAEGEDLDPLATSMYHYGGHEPPKIVRLLLEAGFHPDGRHGDFSPLQQATEYDICVESCRLLIEAGAGGFFRRDNHFGIMCTILHWASYNDGDSESTQLAKAALAACDMNDDVHGVTHLCNWAGTQNMELPRLLVDAGADVMAKKKTGCRGTALHMAAGLLNVEEEEEADYLRDSDEHVELVKWVVSKGALIDAKDYAGNTPIHIAAFLGLRKVVAVLLDLGADPLLRCTSGENLLHRAAQAGCTTMMARFIDLGIDVNAKTDGGNTALHLASQKGVVSCVRVLLDEGAHTDKANDNGWTPLRSAAAHGKADVLECLLDLGKGDLRQAMHGVGSLLHTAAYHGSTAVMQLLVSRGLDVASTIVSNGETVMHNAAQNGGGLSVKWLLDNGASLDVQDYEGRKPQTSGVVVGTCDENVRSALEAIAELEDGKSSMSVMWDGRGLLHSAAAKGFTHCVSFLVSKGAGVNSKAIYGEEETAMHCAVRGNCTGAVRGLAKSGACMDVSDSSGRTPLHLAAAGDDHLEIATELLELGASCNIADSEGKTPLWAAAKQGNLACSSLLVARGADMALRDVQGKNALGASLVGSRSTKTNREEVMKLLIELGCPVGEPEVDAASRGGLTDSFAKAITSRMNGGNSARELVKATSLTCSPAGGWAAAEHIGGILCDAEPAVSVTTVRVSSEPPPTFSRRRRRVSKVATSSKVYHVDGPRLRQAVSHLEGPDEVGKCLLLKLLLPPPVGWAAVYRGDSGGRSSGASTGSALAEPPGSTPSDAVLPSHRRRPVASFMSQVELSCDGDDFDEAGFEAVLEYLSTGQVVGATCGNIHGDAPCDVGTHAVAAHRAAAFFGLPHLQRMVRAWLKANGAEIQDDGTGVLSEPAPGSSGRDVNKKRKFAG